MKLTPLKNFIAAKCANLVISNEYEGNLERQFRDYSGRIEVLQLKRIWTVMRAQRWGGLSQMTMMFRDEIGD